MRMQIPVMIGAGSRQTCWPGRFINMRRSGGHPMAFLQLKDLLELFVNRREFLPIYGFLSRCDIPLF